MAKSVDATIMRQINKRYVTELVYNRGPLSRNDISQLTGLNKATVSSLVDDLIEDQLVNEIGYGLSSGGRKPILLQFSANAGYCIGVDIQISHMTTVLTNMNGEIVFKRVLPMDYANHLISKQKLERILIDEIRLASEKAPSSAHGIIGAGIALPGIVSFESGSTLSLPNIQIDEWNIGSALAHHFTFPVYIDNDGNCGALSEHRQRQVSHLVFVNADVGIGTGVIINGELYRGAQGIAGEFGHMTISAMGALCACGNYGCWEQYGSEQALLRYLREEQVTDLDLSPNFVDTVVQRAAAGNPSCIKACQTLGRYLGIGIANIVNALNPDLVVIGGSISQAANFFLPEVESVLKHRAMAVNKQVSIEISHQDTIVVGAARLCIANTLFQSPLSEVDYLYLP